MVDSRETTSKEKKLIEPTERFSGKFFIAIILSIIGVTILTVMISMVPIAPMEYTASEDPETIFSNFFYLASYLDTSPYNIFIGVWPNPVYYVFVFITMIFLVISGCGFLAQNRKETKALIIINWFLYLFPVIAGVIIHVKLIQVINDVFALPLAFYPISLNLFLNLSLLNDRETFRHWPRLVAVFFSISYFLVWITPIVVPFLLVYELSLFFYLLPSLFLLFLWWIPAEVIGRRSEEKLRQRERRIYYGAIETRKKKVQPLIPSVENDEEANNLQSVIQKVQQEVFGVRRDADVEELVKKEKGKNKRKE